MMIPYTSIRSAILEGLNNYTNRLAILAEQSEEKPPKPYMSIKFTRMGGSDSMSPSEYYNDTEDGVEVREVTNPEINLSVTCYGETDDDSIDLALQAYSWFNSIGYDELRIRDIVVISVESIQNRDSLIGGVMYERRQGFDVRLRVKGEIIRNAASFENVKLNKE